MSNHPKSTPTLTTVFLTLQFGSAPWAWLFGICVASAIFPVLLTPVQYLVNLLAASLINASVLPPSIAFILVYTPSYALFASTNFATFVIGARLRGLFRSSFYRSDLQQTPVTRAQIFDSILAIAIPAALVIAFGEIISATLSFIIRNLGNFLRDFRLEYVLYPRIVRIEAMSAMQFDFYQTMFAAASLNAVRIFEVALLLVAGVSAFVSAKRIEVAILRTCLAVFLVAFLNTISTAIHSWMILPLDIAIAKLGFVVDTQVFMDFAFTAPLLYLLIMTMRTRFIAEPLEIEGGGD